MFYTNTRSPSRVSETVFWQGRHSRPCTYWRTREGTMPRSLRNELDALMKAQMEQLPDWHEAMARPGDNLNLQETVNIVLRWQGIHREMILRLAEEIDRLSGPDGPRH